MRLRFLVVSVIMLILCVGTGYSQTFTGTLDGYWLYNRNTPGSRSSDFRAFDIHNEEFSLNYGELAVDYKPNNVGIRVDFGFGDAAEIVNNNSNDGDFLRHIEQAYITGTKDKFTFDFGKFVTPHGAEVIETKDNWNYSRGLLFTWAIPFYHFGAKGTYVASDNVTVAGYVVNGWNNVRDANTAKSVGFVGMFKPYENLSVTTNYLVGKEHPAGTPNADEVRHMFDGTVTYTAVPDRVWFMGNYDYGMDRDATLQRVVWQGIAAYAKAKASDHLTAAGRYEWFSDRNGFTTGIVPLSGRPKLQSFTATAQIPWEDVTLWGEYRRDWSSLTGGPASDLALFNRTRPDEVPPNTLVDNQDTFTIGLTYTFTKMVR